MEYEVDNRIANKTQLPFTVSLKKRKM